MTLMMYELTLLEAVALVIGALVVAAIVYRKMETRSIESWNSGFREGLQAKPGVIERRLRELTDENSDLKLKLIAAETLAKGELLEWAAFAKRSKSKELQEGLKKIPTSQFSTCPECGEDCGEHKPNCTAGAHERAMTRGPT